MDYPRNTVWYIEARPMVDSPGHAPVGASMGSAVAVHLEIHKSDGTRHEPPQTRKYLLTCGHVVREATNDGKKQKGWGPKLLEIYCFPPGKAYWRTLQNDRPSGVHRGAWRAMHKFSPHAHVDGNVPELERLPQNDWVLLDVEDPRFQFLPAAKLSVVQDELRFGIMGFPGGAVPPGGAAWEDSHVVEAAGPVTYTGERKGEPGMLTLTGDATRPGMSGGGAFAETSKVLAGLHRGSLDAAAAGFAIDLNYILSYLSSKWQLSAAVEIQAPPRPPPERDPCQDLLAGTAPQVPFINRRKLRDNLRQICQSGSAYKAICMSEQGGTGKSWSRHLVAHIAREQGMVMALIKLASTLNIQAACRRIARDLKLDEAAMVQSVLVDQAATETIGQKFAHWLLTELIKKGTPRHLLLVDEIRTAAGTNAPLHEELLIPLAKELADASPDTPLVLILAGAPFPGDETTDPYVLREEMEPLNDKDVASYLHAYAASKNRVLSLPEHAQLMQQITGGTVGTFDKAKMQAVMEATKLILDNRVL